MVSKSPDPFRAIFKVPPRPSQIAAIETQLSSDFSLVQQGGIFSHVFLIRKTQSLDQSMEYMIKGMRTGRECNHGRKNANTSRGLGAPAPV